MSNKIFLTGIMLVALTASSCREESDALQTYDHNDVLIFTEANNSFAAKFKILWNGLNQSYALWDYEQENGLDWDAVYDEYLPQFEALDKRTKENPVTTEELTELMKKAFSPLHDGHLALCMKNHHQNNAMAFLSPSDERNKMRDDFLGSNGFEPQLAYYTNPENGELYTDEEGGTTALEYDTRWNKLIHAFKNTKGTGLKWIEKEIQSLSALTLPTEMEVYRLRALRQLADDIEKVESVEDFNELVLRYEFLDVPGLEPIDPGFKDGGICVKTAILKGGIAYFYLSGFALTPYLVSSQAAAVFKLNWKSTQRHIMNVQKVWSTWFENVQELHKKGQLGGVIIDVRSNGGGYLTDSYFVAGSLLPPGGYQFGYSRFKRGTGRLDYSPLTPSISLTMDEPHETITEPVVILTNCRSISMAEMTTLCVKRMENGTVIGKRTWGGICGLNDNSTFSENYSGHIGIINVTPVYGYIPIVATMDMNKKMLEGIGVTPDIEVDLDVAQLFYTGRDSQLDRALQFIRTKQ